MEALKQGSDALFILLGGIMVLAMHAGFAFLELGTVRKKNQVNALVKILVDFSISTVVYFVVGYGVAYGTHFFVGAEALAAKNGYELVRFFFLLTFAAAIPAIISGGIAERARFYPQLIATAVIVGFVYPFFEGIVWNNHFGLQAWIKAATGAEFHDFAGSIVVHALGGWLALPAVILLGARSKLFRADEEAGPVGNRVANQEVHDRGDRKVDQDLDQGIDLIFLSDRSQFEKGKTGMHGQHHDAAQQNEQSVGALF